MQTLVRKLDPSGCRSMCGIVAKLIPLLKWRHAGLGVLQAYIHEGEDREQRVHVWHPSLRRAGIEESGLFHDHRFDMDSAVLIGGIRQAEHEIMRNVFGEWVLHEVVHAREAAERNKTGTGSYHLPPSELPTRYAIKTIESLVPAGYAYTFPKREFHGTHPVGLTVTVVEKLAQENFRARILAPLGKPLVHAFSDPLPESEWAPILTEAVEMLKRSWEIGIVP